MDTQKMKWHTVGLPQRLFERVKLILSKTGNMSISEYVRWAVDEKLRVDETRLFELFEEEEEIKERLKD